MSSLDLTRKRKHSDVSATSTASHRQKAISSAITLAPAQTRDDDAGTVISHSSTARFYNCVAQDQARVRYGNTYVQNQCNDHAPGSQEPPKITKQRIDFTEALSFDHMDSRYESIEPAHMNTCQWLFQKPEFVQYRDPEHLKFHSGFLWIKGKAGSGKSTLMKCAFEHAKTHF
jgi:predicted ATPase